MNINEYAKSIDLYYCVKDENSVFIEASEFYYRSKGFLSYDNVIGSDDYHVPSPISELAEKLVEQDRILLASGSKKSAKFISHAIFSKTQKFTFLIQKTVVINSLNGRSQVCIFGMDITQNIKLRNMIALSNSFFTGKQHLENLQFSVELMDGYPEITTTPRETECLFFCMRGWSSKRIANRLKISTKTVERHLENIRMKANCYNRAELVERCITEGMVDIFPNSIVNL